jgi:hypothetical protein
MSKYKYMRSVSLNIDVDVDEIVYSMDRRQKESMYELLKEEFEEDDDTLSVGTTSEKELMDVCNKIYENRNSLTNEDKALLVKLSKKGWYEKVV